MAKYEVIPEEVEAVKVNFETGDPENHGNWYEVENMLGPWRAARPSVVSGYSVFDVRTQKWHSVGQGEYVVLFEDQSVEVWGADPFEEKYRVRAYGATIMTPNPWTINYNSGPHVI